MIPCINCQRDALSEIFATRDRRRRHDCTRYAVFWCDDCALGRVNFSGGDNAEFFNTPYYTHGDQAVARGGNTTLTRISWRFDHGRDLSPADFANASTFCDIGCGDGSHLKRFREAGFKVVGIEPDAIARRRASAFGQVFDGTAETIPPDLSSARFDVVLMSHVLDACIDPRIALTNAAALLGDGGTLVIEVPNCASLGFRTFGPDWPWVDIPRHLTFFTEASLRAMIERAGLNVESVHHVGYTRQFKSGVGWKWLARTAFVPANDKYDTMRIHATR